MVNLMMKKDTCMKNIFIWNIPLPHNYKLYSIKNKQANISTTLNSFQVILIGYVLYRGLQYVKVFQWIKFRISLKETAD